MESLFLRVRAKPDLCLFSGSEWLLKKSAKRVDIRYFFDCVNARFLIKFSRYNIFGKTICHYLSMPLCFGIVSCVFDCSSFSTNFLRPSVLIPFCMVSL